MRISLIWYNLNIMKTLYGLPENVLFCRKCVISNQRPNSAVEYRHTKDTKKQTIHFDKEGICDACLVAEEKKNINWTKREKELIKLCDRFRKSSGQYDCIVPGSGGKDSFFAAHKLKYQYGMHPLTVTWAPHIYTDWGWKNMQSWIHAGLDNVMFTPNGKVHRLLTRLAVDNLFHPFQPFMIGQKALAPKMAALYKIPLVFYGENEAEYGNPKADAEKSQRDWSYFTAEDKSKIFIGGTSFKDLTSKYGVEEYELQPYLPADPKELKKVGIQVHYLGYYLKWHPQGAYYYAKEHGNFQASPERTPGTYSKYNSIDDKIDDLHYYTTFIKFGIGRATYDASQEIRSGEITRDEGVSLVQRFDGEWPARFEDELWKYLSINREEFPQAYKAFQYPAMTKEKFMKLADKFRSPHLWKKEEREWKLKYKVKNV